MIATLLGLLKEAVVDRNDDFARFLHAFKAALAIILSPIEELRTAAVFEAAEIRLHNDVQQTECRSRRLQSRLSSKDDALPELVGLQLTKLPAGVATGTVGAAWIALEWTNGYIAGLSAAITIGFFLLSATPVAASWQAFARCAIACVVSVVVNIMLMPGFCVVSLLALCFGILLFFSSHAANFPRFASMGAGFSAYLCYLLTPSNVAVYDPPYLLDGGLGLPIVIGVRAMALSLVAPKEGEWLAKQYARHIGDALLRAATDPVDEEKSGKLAMPTRDRIVRIVTVPGVPQAYHEKITKWAFGRLWIANALIHVRALAESEANALPPAWEAAQREWLYAIECVAANASFGALEASLSKGAHVLDLLRRHAGLSSWGTGRAIFEMRAGFYSGGAALMDQMTGVAKNQAIAS